MTQWLKCKIGKGMFSDESNVVVRMANGENFAAFVPTEATDQDENRVRVRVIQSMGRMSRTLIPDEYQSVVVVDSSELQPR